MDELKLLAAAATLDRIFCAPVVPLKFLTLFCPGGLMTLGTASG
jgi:hypothetical protein